VTATRRRLPVRIVVIATMVMTAAVLAAVAAVLDHSGQDAGSETRQEPLTAWLKPEKVADHGHYSGPSPRLAGLPGALAGAG
jgi:hypothetical protein